MGNLFRVTLDRPPALCGEHFRHCLAKGIEIYEKEKLIRTEDVVAGPALIIRHLIQGWQAAWGSGNRLEWIELEDLDTQQVRRFAGLSGVSFGPWQDLGPVHLGQMSVVQGMAFMYREEIELRKVVRWPDGNMVDFEDYHPEQYSHRSDDVEVVWVPETEYLG